MTSRERPPRLEIRFLENVGVLILINFLPIMGAISSVGVGFYALIIGAHLIGLLFRRNTKMLESIYLGR